MHTPDNKPNLIDINSFFKLPKPNKKQTDQLDMPLTLDEFNTALNKMPNNKVPGPDGFPAEFFKHFWNIISPLFLKMVQHIKYSSTLLFYT